MIQRRGLGVSEQALRVIQSEKSPLPDSWQTGCRKGRPAKSLEEFRMVMHRRLDLLQSSRSRGIPSARGPARPARRRGCSGPLCCRGVFSVVYPGDAEGDARVEFARNVLGVVIPLPLHRDRGIGNPLATGKLHFSLGLDLRLSRANLRALSQHPGPELRQRQAYAAQGLLPSAERVKASRFIRMLSCDFSSEIMRSIPAGLLKLAGLGLSKKSVSR